jgi:hypothetical protein
MARPERFELPTAWFVVFHLNLCIFLQLFTFMQLSLSNKIGLFERIYLFLKLFGTVYWTAKAMSLTSPYN